MSEGLFYFLSKLAPEGQAKIMDGNGPAQPNPARPAPSSPPFGYDARLAGEIEQRWQRQWATEGTFDAPNPVGALAAGFDRAAGQPKFYVLDMFPYPSGAGLHVGHPIGYIGTDVYARYLRMTGHNVLHPFGYDAFGLPAEQYAIDTGQHPSVTTRNNIDNMRRQLRRLGLGHDTRREIVTSDPGYYRWTQWIFLQIFNSWFDDRADRARPIADLIAEFESGARPIPGDRAWTDLSQAERRQLIDDHRLAYISTQLVNWCPGLGTVLANEEVTADGRSDIGNYPVYRRPLRQWVLRITAFAQRLIDDLDQVDWPESIRQMQRNWIGRSDGARIDLPVAGRPGTSIEVFTTRPDTLPGATFLVMAPEHPLVEQLLTGTWPPGTDPAVTYPQASADAADWTPKDAVAAYRDATGRLSERQRTGETEHKSGVFTGAHAINPATGAPIPIFIADYVLMAYGTGAIMAVPEHDERDLEFARRFGLEVVPAATAPADWPEGIDGAVEWLERTGHGRRARSYRLRDWLFSRQRYWGEPFPIVYDELGLPLPVPEAELPVRLPEMTDFAPRVQEGELSDPVPPLARATDWVTVQLDLGDGMRTYRRELNTMPQWAGSCWYYLRYTDPGNDQVFADPEVERYWMAAREQAFPGDGGVDLYVGGVEHAVLHLLYARFWHKVLYDLGYVSTKEPFRRLFNQGYILADAFTDARGMYVPAAEVTPDDEGRPTYHGAPVTRRAGKMGKSLKNSVNPDDIYVQYGADTLRLYEMAMGPLDTDRPWRTHDMVGVHRFLQRLWRSLIDEETGQVRVSDGSPDDDSLRRLHQTITVVRDDFAAMRFNTAIARLIELVSHVSKVAAASGPLPRSLAEPIVLLVAPLAPHVAEELWQRLGHETSLAFEPFPVPDPALTIRTSVQVPVQLNGKARFAIEVPASAGQEETEEILRSDPAFKRLTEGLTIERLIIVPGRIASIVAKPPPR
jgi:leucyl-tRNA synthetase